MAFNSEHLYVQWGGKLPGSEQWSCGFRMRKKTPGAVDSGAGLLAGVAAAIIAYHIDSRTHISAAAQVSFVKVNAITTGGLYRDEGTNQAVYPDVGGAWTGVSIFPNQICLVVSLTTGFSRGLAHTGRYYLPLPRFDLDAGGRISVMDADEVSDSTDTFRNNVNNVSADYEMAVFSRRGSGGNRRVTGNRVGRVLDTQRRRRRSLVEDYQ